MAEDREITVGRANRAAALLNDELLAESFKALEEAYVQRWRSTNIEDVVGREKLFLAINVVGKVQQNLNTILSNGKLAARELKDLAEEAERKKSK